MRKVAWVLLAGMILLAGCESNSAITGKWIGSIGEGSTTRKIALDLRAQGKEIAGTFTMFEGEIIAGVPVAIANGHRTEGKLEFIVPISGEAIAADALFFVLTPKEGRLEGYGRKMRIGSQDLPVVFVRQK